MMPRRQTFRHRVFQVSLCTCLSLATWVYGQDRDIGEAPPPIPIIEYIGDSITAGNSTDPGSSPYPEELEHLLDNRYRVVNSRVPGAHTLTLLERFHSNISREKPERIVVLAGVNDVNIWDGQDRSGYGPVAVIERLRALGLAANHVGARTLYATFSPDDDFTGRKIAAVRKINEWILTRAAREVPGAMAVDLMQTMTGQPGIRAGVVADTLRNR